jgi:nucleoside-diphosphate-sugar epimerase
MTAVILGCGYTGVRVARRLARRGMGVIATTRHPDRLSGVPAEIVRLDVLESADLSFMPEGSAVLYSIPVTKPDVAQRVLADLEGRARRVVYLSTTGIYGSAVDVDESTPVAPLDESSRLRVAAEQAVLQGPWSALVLRPAAIYGPGRGVHVRIQRGDFSLPGDGSNYVSRIHVEDLAAHAEAALLSDVTGAYPVADDEPCTSREIAEFCAALLGVPLPPSAPIGELHQTRRANRRVNGAAIRRLLGVKLEFPSFRLGIPASLSDKS